MNRNSKNLYESYKFKSAILTIIILIINFLIISLLIVNSQNSITKFHYLIVFLAILLFILISFLLFSIYKNIFSPINKLQKNMSNFSLNTFNPIPISNDTKALQPVLSNINTTFNKLNKLILLIENLNKNIPFNDILKYIFNSFSEYIPYSHIGVALIDENKNSIRASYGVSRSQHKNLSKRLIGYQTSISLTSLGTIIDTGQIRVINDLEEYLRGKTINEYNKILLSEGIRSSITFPLKNNNNIIGIIFFSSNEKNVYTKDHINFLNTLANSIMLSIEEDILMDDMIISTVLSLAKLTEERDPETGDHIERMKKYSVFISKLLASNEKYSDIVNFEYIQNIERFSPLHDIGKVAVSDDILLKPGKLTKDEFEVMKTHTTYGGKTLRMSEDVLKKRGRSVFKMGIEITEAHHEKWDGSGYPKGLKEYDIPLSARIVAIADVFDALTSKRPYKKPFSFEDSINMIEKDAGTHFDPHIVKILIENIDSLKHLYSSLNNELTENKANIIS